MSQRHSSLALEASRFMYRSRMQAHQVSNKPAIWYLFSLYVLSLILLPAGSIDGINVRLLLFFPLMLVAANKLARQTTAPAQYAFGIIVVFFLALSVVRSFASPFYAELALSQAKDFLVTLAGCLFVRLFTQTSLDQHKFLRLCIYASACGGILKLLLLAYSMVTGASVENIVDAVSAIFGVKLMSMDIDGAGGRLQLPSDILLPIALFTVICQRRQLRIKAFVAVLIVALLTFSSVYTFSRFIWANTILAALLGGFFVGGDKIVAVYLAIAAGGAAYFFPILSALVTLRFSKALAGSSDMQRIWQIAALKTFFWDAPLFGHGIGSYVLNLVRSTDAPYVYEVQAGALLCQFGIIGSGGLIYLLINYYRKAFSFQQDQRTYQVAVLLLLLTFLIAGLSNPNLLNAISSVSYGAIFVLALTHPKQCPWSPVEVR